MTHLFNALGLIAPQALFTLGFPAADAQANDMFPTRAAAEKHAKQPMLRRLCHR
jgi:hypothetical protein